MSGWPLIPDWRSLLFVSADDPVRLAKAHSRGADALILDLEDAVPAVRKDAARAALPGEIERLHGLGQPLVVRVNTGWRALAADLAAAIHPGVSAIMLPKVEDGWRVRAAAELIGEWEAERGLEPGAIGIICLIESAAGLAAMPQLAASPRLIGLALGSEDLALTLNVAPTADFLDLPCRQIAMAASQSGVMAIGLPLSIAEFRDMDAYAAAVARGRGYGATAALCIHPAQVETANRLFGPDEQELANARAIVAAWEAHGGAGVLQLDGKMIDLPVVLRAQRLVARN
ncbi:CoA ester lyase [Sphingobium aromaticivastans]|uniref:HpcH/HpaI aldolase/citrate lyase family protein n=1 Tax=Sphingobium aromaticivastans TaxID=1778665 RepID=UPI00301A8E56